MISTWALLAGLVIVAVTIASIFARMLSRRYRTENEAHEAARAAVSARDELLGIVAHDLRNPLGAITMKAATMRKVAVAEPARKQAAAIENVALRMDYIIKTLLDVASVEAGQFSVNPAPCRVEDLLQETVELFGSVAASKSIRLDREGTDSGLMINGDRDRVLQVLSNLVGNAIKFTPQGGHVNISVERAGDRIRFAVADTGPGIAAEHASRIFDRFWKEEKAGSKGTGLGLFIARRIVEAHGGRIWMESPAGQGATFFFVLPSGAPAVPPAFDAAIPIAAGGRGETGGEPSHRR
jgi:signal transduction histidine kinase